MLDQPFAMRQQRYAHCLPTNEARRPSFGSSPEVEWKRRSFPDGGRAAWVDVGDVVEANARIDESSACA
jgi:hypothetical protein